VPPIQKAYLPYLVLIALGKQDAITGNAAQIIADWLGLLKVIDLGHKQLAQCLGAG
jgi:hypothetical protein